MVKKHKNGFTLVELLAVIVILAIILVIAVPQIMKTIDNAREGALSSSAKLIAASAEREYLVRETLGDTEFNPENVEMECSEVADTTADYSDCDITFTNGKAYVSLTGSGKFEGKYVCNGTRESATVTETACSGGGDPEGDDSQTGDNLKSYIETLAANATTAETHGLVTIDHTEGGTKTVPAGGTTSIRYAGANPQNYVGFGACTEAEITADPTGCELWRIIGIVDGKVKLVKKDSITSKAYDAGNNIWITTTGVKADINSYLNDGGEGQYKLPTGLSNLVEISTWYLGGHSTSDVSNNEMYIYERGDAVYQKDSRNVAVTENTKVGLMYPSDYAYATKSAECTKTMYGYDTQSACTTNNWIYQDQGRSTYQWLISPNSVGNSAFFVQTAGYVDPYFYVRNDYQVRGAVYLNSNVLKTGGSGTSGSPYTLGLSS